VSGTAELLEDGGEAATGPEFFRSRPFMAAEQVTHTLRIALDGQQLLAPLVVREIAGSSQRDASSPYGYPGMVGPAGLRADPERTDWSGTGLVSVFVRHRVGADPPLAGATERGTVYLADPALPRKSRPSDRRQIRRNAENGYEVRSLPGPQASATDRAAFAEVYRQTMERADADRRYFFSDDYFTRILASEQSWLFLALDPGGEVAAASIAVRSDALLHYYLSATADRCLADSPMKNLVAALVEHAERLALPLNLGGGVSAGDALEEFKRGFANRTATFHTSEVICDRESYERLADGREAHGFFPAYRAP
jgi:hypothetical protein